MASNQQRLYIRGINLKKKLRLIIHVFDLIDLSTQYQIWRDEIIKAAKGRGLVSKIANIDTAIWELSNAGVGAQLESDRSRKIVSILIKDIEKVLTTLENSELPTSNPLYDSETRHLHFGDKIIKITDRSDTNSTKLLRLLFSTPQKKWNRDEIYEALEEEYDSTRSSNRYYNAARNINSIVGQQTGCTDFIAYKETEFEINPKYL
jgi:hypothetical protein